MHVIGLPYARHVAVRRLQSSVRRHTLRIADVHCAPYPSSMCLSILLCQACIVRPLIICTSALPLPFAHFASHLSFTLSFDNYFNTFLFASSMVAIALEPVVHLPPAVIDSLFTCRITYRLLPTCLHCDKLLQSFDTNVSVC